MQVQIPKTFKAVGFKKYGPPAEVLHAYSSSLPRDAPARGLLLKTIYSSINPADLNQVEGIYPLKPRFAFPFGAIGGNECLAQILKVGSDAYDPLTKDTPKVGEWVIASSAGSISGWCNYSVCQDVTDVVRLGITEDPYAQQLPTAFGNLNGLAAATIAINPGTAYCMLNDIKKLEKGQVVVQNGANSAVGQYVIQLARIWGYKTVNVVRKRSTEQETNGLFNYLKALGGDLVVDYDEFETDSVKEEIKRLSNGSGPALAFNCIGGKSASQLFCTLGKDGVLVSYGAMSKQPLTFPTGPFIFKNVSATGYWFSKSVKDMGRERFSSLIAKLKQLYVDKHLAPANMSVMEISGSDSESVVFEKFQRALTNSTKTIIQWK